MKVVRTIAPFLDIRELLTLGATSERVNGAVTVTLMEDEDD